MVCALLGMGLVIIGSALSDDGAPGTAAPQVKVRCPAGRRLNDEAAKFCDRCGSAI
jgi:hypothetical protein